MFRPFLSYTSADRDFVEMVAARLVAYGLVPIYDHWWLRSAAVGDAVDSMAEIKMGVNHADAFVHFGSNAARQSIFADYECEWAFWRACSDSPNLPMVYVFLDDRNVHVPHWFHATLDATPEVREVESLTASLIDALGIHANEGVSPAVYACRQLAHSSDLAQLRSEICNPNEEVRCEAAILLALLEDGMDPSVLSAVVSELARGLRTAEADRAILALGKLKAQAAPAVDGIVRFIESEADQHIRARALRLLGRIGPRSETISVLIRVATRPTGIRAAAVTELGEMGSSARSAVPTLIELSDSPDRQLRLVALTALGNIGDCNPGVLVAVLKALSETEGWGISPSQLHHNAMCLFNQLAPKDDELAPALLLAWRESRKVSAWLEETYPDTAALIRSGISGDKLKAGLLSTARKVLAGCRMVGGTRPF